MRMPALILAGLIAAPALGQAVSPLNPAQPVNTAALATKADVAAVQAAIPAASTAIPAPSTDMGSVGTNAARFSIEGHDHPSKGRKARVAITSEFVTWTFANPFAAGEIPVCLANAEVAAPSTELVNVQVYGVPTNTRCVFQVTRISRGVVGLIPNVLSINLTPYSGFIHMRAESQ